jgi:hypothetical protein
MTAAGALQAYDSLIPMLILFAVLSSLAASCTLSF